MLEMIKIWLIGLLLPENYEIVRRKYQYKAITLNKEEYNVNEVSLSYRN